MDIASITAAARTVDITHPATGEPIGLKVELLPDSDDKVQTAKRKWLNERLQRNKKLTVEAAEAHSINVIEAAVTGWKWEGDLTFHGEKPTFTPGALRKVLKELPWVKAQIDTELGDEAAFFRNSGQS